MIAPMATLGMRDRQAGTVTLTSSLSLWKKLERMRRNPGVAIVYHAREHAFTDRPEFVLVQGRASFDTNPDRAWLESIEPEWTRFLGKRYRGPIGRAQHVYYWERIAITVQIERIQVWPDGTAGGKPQVFGSPVPASPDPQNPPKKGTRPRVDSEKVSSSIAKRPHTLLGWCGSDQIPDVVPVTGSQVTSEGLRLAVPPNRVPDGGRRAGLTAHWFGKQMIGQKQTLVTGWMESSGGEVTYAPHSSAGYGLPASKPLYIFATASLATRMRAARKAGIAPST
jgi:hypothetical protein